MRILLIMISIVLTMISCSKSKKVDDATNKAQNVVATVEALEIDRAPDMVTLKWKYEGVNPYCFKVLKHFTALNNPNTTPPLNKYALIARLDSGKRTFIDEKVDKSGTYSYFVVTCREDVENASPQVVRAGSNYSLIAPELFSPNVSENTILLRWKVDKDTNLSQIYRKASTQTNFQLVANVQHQANVVEYNRPDDPGTDGYYEYYINTCNSQNQCIKSGTKGVALGKLYPGELEAFSALALPSDDIVVQWKYTSSIESSVIIDLSIVDNSNQQVVISKTSYKRFSTHDERLKRASFGIARFPISEFRSKLGNNYTFILKAYTFLGVRSQNTLQASVNINPSSSAYNLSIQGDTITNNGSIVTLNHNYSQNGFITNFSVYRSILVGSQYTSVIKVADNNQFVTSMPGIDPYFEEFWGTVSPTLQRQQGNTYCYQFEISNGVNTVKTSWGGCKAY